MDLGTFGAILKFAIDFEEGCVKFYHEIGPGDGRWPAFASDAEKRVRALGRVRREMVTEMILEPIAGLQSGDYACDWVAGAPEQLIAQARSIEEVGRRFYQDVSSRVSIPEVGRTFLKFAQAHESNRIALG